MSRPASVALAPAGTTPNSTPARPALRLEGGDGRTAAGSLPEAYIATLADALAGAIVADLRRDGEPMVASLGGADHPGGTGRDPAERRRDG